MDKKTGILFAITFFVSSLVCAFLIGRSLERFKTEDRYIAVRGFAEREVKADLAVWPIRLSVTSNDLSEGSKLIESATLKVSRFLTQNGISPDEIVQKDLKVNDRKANEYGSTNAPLAPRYIITKTIQVRSINVENLQKVSRMTDDLLRAGVAISSTNDWQGTGVRFTFTKLNEIKPAMLAEATRNAQKAALEFTKESNVSLGSMRRANQGLFTVADRDEASSGQAEGGYYGPGSNDMIKKVRVVISVEYSLK